MSKYRTHTFLSVELQCVRVQWCTRLSPRVCCYCCCLNTIQIGTRHTTPTKVTHKLVYLLLLPLKYDSNREKLSHSGRKHILPAQFIIIPLSVCMVDEDTKKWSDLIVWRRCAPVSALKVISCNHNNAWNISFSISIRISSCVAHSLSLCSLSFFRYR